MNTKLSTQAIQRGYPLDLVARIEAEEERETRLVFSPALDADFYRRFVYGGPNFQEPPVVRPAFLR